MRVRCPPVEGLKRDLARVLSDAALEAVVVGNDFEYFLPLLVGDSATIVDAACIPSQQAIVPQSPICLSVIG
jgi:hypothetical protein